MDIDGTCSIAMLNHQMSFIQCCIIEIFCCVYMLICFGNYARSSNGAWIEDDRRWSKTWIVSSWSTLRMQKKKVSWATCLALLLNWSTNKIKWNKNKKHTHTITSQALIKHAKIMTASSACHPYRMVGRSSAEFSPEPRLLLICNDGCRAGWVLVTKKQIPWKSQPWVL